MACPQCGKESPSNWTLCDDCMAKEQESIISKEELRGNDIIEKCHYCNTELYQLQPRGGSRIIYKYCTKCGKENNFSIKTEHFSRNDTCFSLCALIGLIATITFFVSCLAQRTINLYNIITKFIEFIVFIGLIAFLPWLLVTKFIYNKTCSHCNCKGLWWHKFCYNCGKPLKRTQE